MTAPEALRLCLKLGSSGPPNMTQLTFATARSGNADCAGQRQQAACLEASTRSHNGAHVKQALTSPLRVSTSATSAFWSLRPRRLF